MTRTRRRKPRWHPAALRGAYGAALRQVAGYGTYTERDKTKAVLFIGRKAGLSYGRWREGQTISPRAALRSVFDARARQVDPLEVAGTMTIATGYYGGGREPSTKIEIVWTPGQEKSREGFIKNVRQLAQRVAGDLAQREVLVEWEAPRMRGRVDSATPAKAPPPTQPRKFCEWVQKHSPSARSNKRDRCNPRNPRYPTS